MLVNSIVAIVISVFSLLGVIVSILSFFITTPEGQKLKINLRGMVAIIIFFMILCAGLVLLQHFPIQEGDSSPPDFDWDYEYFDGANLCIMTHDGNSYSLDDVFLAIGFPEKNKSVICESPTPSVWVEIHPLASYEVAAFYDFGEYSQQISTAYTQLPELSSPDAVQMVHLYLP